VIKAKKMQSSAERLRKACHIESLEKRVLLSVNVISYHNDTSNDGVNNGEVQLTPANVKVGAFGKLFTTPLDGQVYAQPLVDSSVNITSGVNTTGSTGVHNVVFVATENDSIYAIDASVAGGAVLWKRSFLTGNSGGNQNNTLGASSISVVTSGDVGTTDISPTIGITGTPVIDATNGIMYVVAATKEVIGGSTYFVQRLHAINISNGTDTVAPYLLGTTTNGNTNNTPIYCYGTGDGAVTDPYNGTGKQVVQFNALRESQRTALSLVNNTVYVSYASHGDNGPYHGWVIAWNVSALSSSGFQLKGVFNTCPNDGEAGIWGGGGQLVFDPDASENGAFYFMTGNGTGGAPTLGANGLPTDANYNEAVVKAVLDPTTSPTNQGPNGWGIKATDFFIPYNVSSLDGADSDFGSGAPLLLPDSAGIPGHTRLMVVGGKDGRLFLLDRDNLGKYNKTSDAALNAVPNGQGDNTAPNLITGLLSSPAYYNGKVYAVSGYSGAAYAYSISSTGQMFASSQTSIGSFGYLPGGPSISANNGSNGIVWLEDRNLNELHAYDANTLNTELWNSNQSGSDAPGALDKFNVPTVANGEVYVGTSNSLVVYGLTPPAGTVPQSPVLTATALSGTSVNLTWTDPSVAPNLASGYLIEESTNGTSFTQITTAPAAATSIAIGGLNNNTKYYFRIRGFNGVGDSGYSNISNATTSSQAAAVNLASGFASAASQLALNGSAKINGSALELTDGGANEAASAFTNFGVGVANFSTQFTFQLSPNAGTADGFTFTLQNAGSNAIGSPGGGLGYGPNPGGTQTASIPNSIAIKFDLYSNSGEGADSTGLFTGGATPTNIGSIDLSSTGINLHSGDTFQVIMTYNGTTLNVVITDTNTGADAIQNYTVNIPGVIGSSTAFAGFTAGTGGSTATQNILTWTYNTATAAVSPNAPTGLGATPASATSISLSWTANSSNQTGYHLDRATSADFTQNLITETLPATPASFTDITTGLAPGSTYYYRLRAFNSAGDSGNSNQVSVTIPVAPAKPTLQSITGVTSNSISMSWQDNAGNTAQGYNILRAVNHGSFSIVATLPPTSRPAPSEYDWTDNTVTPGNYYEYHIEAYDVSGNNDFAGVNAYSLTSAPTVTATPASGAVNLSWSAPTGAVTYNVYRGTTPGGESATPIATGLTTTSYSDTNLTNGSPYYYEVTAVNANTTYTPPLPSESAPSAEVSAIPGTTISTGSLADVDFGGPGIAGSASYNSSIGCLYGLWRRLGHLEQYRPVQLRFHFRRRQRDADAEVTSLTAPIRGPRRD
jgi:fibronectin type 3 domain-containing protein